MELLIPLLILVALLVWREIAHDRERAELLDRIQAPELVVARRSPDPSEEDLHIAPEDDEGFAEYLEARG